MAALAAVVFCLLLKSLLAEVSALQAADQRSHGLATWSLTNRLFDDFVIKIIDRHTPIDNDGLANNT